MTNKEIDRAIARIERKTLVRSILTFPINVSALIVFSALALFAGAVGEFVIALLILVVVASVFSLSIGAGIQKHYRNKRIRFWNCVRKRGLFDEEPTSDTKLLIDKIVGIQTATPGSELLTLRQAIKLVTVYERQSRQLETVKARLANLDSVNQKLRQKIKQLQDLGENHAAGLQSLAQTRAEFESLQKLASAMQSSCDRLEAILNKVTKTARARQLHRELDQLSAPVIKTAANDEPAFEAESLEDIERQIGREIETYLQLERETDEHLR